jgi:hypothetical protein
MVEQSSYKGQVVGSIPTSGTSYTRQHPMVPFSDGRAVLPRSTRGYGRQQIMEGLWSGRRNVSRFLPAKIHDVVRARASLPYLLVGRKQFRRTSEL